MAENTRKGTNTTILINGQRGAAYIKVHKRRHIGYLGASRMMASSTSPVDDSTPSPSADASLGLTKPTTHLRIKHAPFKLMHPTYLEDDHTTAQGTQWHSRASRKHLYTVKLAKVHLDKPSTDAEKATTSEFKIRGELRLRTCHPHSLLKPRLAWDISFWVAVWFVCGSAAWIINGFLLFIPLLYESSSQGVQAAAWGFVGGTFFEVGAFLMFIESLNSGHEELYKKALRSILNEDGGTRKQERGKLRLFGLAPFRDIGFLGSTIQLCSASIFWISTLTGLPGVIPGFPGTSSVAITDVFYWTPQVIGGTGFTIASVLFSLECQKAWWKPNPSSLGWHVGFWNLLGSVGFTLCGAFGYGSVGNSWMNYQSILSTFWGSWAFMIGSLCQLWESIWREANT
ncbi:uncharacterized protein EI90DRAFT_3039477 [Cantharellus anzutake]|uniref:uncharacterized protein n=1 Tax=Cantharellus anzutake TaxID=1750568 RepID=UPI0019031847|nr:uncharacterized protein EI90DRAFT_3039477 [Cantharellus anzutake]KAF8338865.1 hypothetical protein EI90DRAFT_3039477 [Cantharellus anzutake]